MSSSLTPIALPAPLTVYWRTTGPHAMDAQPYASVAAALLAALQDLHGEQATPAAIRCDGVVVFDRARIAAVYADLRPLLSAEPQRVPARVAQLAGEAMVLVEAAWSANRNA